MGASPDRSYEIIRPQGTVMPPDARDLSLTQLDTILAHLPIFEQPSFSAGTWSSAEGQIPYWSNSPEVEAFLDTLYRERFLVTFDWVAWSGEAQRYIAGGDAALANADLTTLRMLLSAHIRADRFIECTIGSLAAEGHIAAVLRRLKQIRDEIAAQESSNGS